MASQKTPAPTKAPYEKGKHAVGPEAFRQIQNSRLLLERTLQGARELDEGKGIPWADFVKGMRGERERGLRNAPPVDAVLSPSDAG